jgi:hypothetical protein
VKGGGYGASQNIIVTTNLAEKALSGWANQETQDDVWSVNVIRKK